ncbi:hypothetical protein Z043_110656 [Scleropages formosus]|uniref:Ig-like domain-containing protein n=1 Tax=Scleropages formosus TaxID=113540 RepID=A0A0P7UL08_SCLFO|nr:hypothetical protein Z043_110656 [Scleropages formosus]
MKRNISYPEVQILPPSSQEIEDKKRVTLVCVATGFYPDHITITWYLNDRRDERSVQDETAVQAPDKTYSITSRLRISVKEWQRSRNKFKCHVEFYAENGTKSFTKEIQGKKCGFTAEITKLSCRMLQTLTESQAFICHTFFRIHEFGTGKEQQAERGSVGRPPGTLEADFIVEYSSDISTAALASA